MPRFERPSAIRPSTARSRAVSPASRSSDVRRPRKLATISGSRTVPPFDAVLAQEYGAKQVVYATKFSYSAPCAEETIAALVAACDAIIHGIAD